MTTTTNRPDRNLALELVRVTEAGALAAAKLAGKGDKIAADQAAVDAMRGVLDGVAMNGVVVIGEGEKDEAPMLFNGESVGDGTGPEMEIAVDPLEGTTLCAKGMPNALSVIALSPKGTMFDPGPCVYMEKLAAGADVADLLDLDRPIGETLKLMAQRRACAVNDLTVIVLDRPRHEDGIKEIRDAGARVRLISDGDVSAVLVAVSPDRPIDLLWGVGGTPEGVLAAAAVKCIGGGLIGRLWPRDEGEKQAAIDAGYDLDRQLSQDDLVTGDDCFFSATGVTDGDLLQGVRSQGAGSWTTESLVMRSRSGTVRRIMAQHNRAKLRELNPEMYG
ncbi:class II fructose-bisphosphatase [Paraconexibacter algicola]|uniref:Fructose-1,6-bisphosphatase n=1 Tax=Paraconexibacter algicola TaxID=2133960 RepID=A0A2T4UMM9_9ACTN|nr:class II fructose-bisphosphatase [Paraconexibacter algicola]PTL60461.1 fructose-bisphosphatase class II [Paraconexibacter algicola]